MDFVLHRYCFESCTLHDNLPCNKVVRLVNIMVISRILLHILFAITFSLSDAAIRQEKDLQQQEVLLQGRNDNFGDRSLLFGFKNQIEDLWNSKTLGLTERSIDHDGLTRWFLEHSPKNFPSSSGTLVILLHGGIGSMYKVFRKSSGRATRRWIDVSNHNGFLLLAPNGVNAKNNADTRNRDGQVWNDFRENSTTSTNADDVGFIISMVQWAIRDRGIDPSRVFVTGASNGGGMTYRLLIEQSSTFAAGVAFIANLSTVDVPNAGSPTPIMIMNGTRDPIMPWEGGNVAERYGSVRSAIATRDYWINANNVNVGAVMREDLPDLDPTDACSISLEAYPANSGGAQVLFYIMEGGGHLLPTRMGGFDLFDFLRGPQCRDAEAVDLAWAFMNTVA